MQPPAATTLNDPQAAVAVLKDEAIDAARRGADPNWYTTALRGVRILARRNQYLTSDDVWEWIRPLEIETLRDPRAMGAVMRSSRIDEVIAPTNEFRISERPACHGRPIRIWKSLRYQTDS